MEGDTYSVPEAARVLRVTPGRVRQLLDAGDLEGEKEGGRWRILQRSVHARLEAHPRRPPEATSEGAESDAELRARVEHLQYLLGRSEGQRELEEITRSTLREQLDRERKRADRLEEELRQEREHRIAALKEASGERQADQSAPENAGGGSSTPDEAPAEPETGTKRPWWRRLLSER